VELKDLWNGRDNCFKEMSYPAPIWITTGKDPRSSGKILDQNLKDEQTELCVAIVVLGK
jgi:hypothetical protein